MKKFLLLVFINLFSFFVFSQETRVPLKYNSVLQELNATELNAQNSELGKTNSGNFPFYDYFNNTNSQVPDSAIWLNSGTELKPLWVVFNSKDLSGTHYQTGFSQADVLTSRTIQTVNAPNIAFIHFAYSSGKDWQMGDSLVLQFWSDKGDWQNIWVSAQQKVESKDVFVNIKLGLLRSNQIRFVNYCNTDSIIEEDFLVSRFVFSSKNAVPFYENFRVFDSKTQLPNKNSWITYRNEVTNGDSIAMKSGNALLFNSITDKKDSAYFNSNNQYGGCDTLISNPFDFTTFTADENLYLSFSYRAFSNTKLSDSLTLDVFDNLGRWQRVWAVRDSSKQFKKITIPLNVGRYRHSLFAFRFINKGNYTSNDTLNYALASVKITSKQFLPFIDDFSSSSIYPDKIKWTDRDVFINNNFPIAQPSLNVATFDGLNEYGSPYEIYSTIGVRGSADKLSSKGFNLAGLTDADSVYLSFYYQYEPQGNTQDIFPFDSLVLEFKSNPNEKDSFETVWMQSALDTPLNIFRTKFILVSSKYLHDDFQFRFKNIGSLSGNVSQWHLDYVRLDKNRNRTDLSYNDVTISSTPSQLLKNYRSMPWSHFVLDSANSINDTQFFSIKNNDSNPRGVDYFRKIYNPSETIIDSIGNVKGNVLAGNMENLFLSKHVPFATSSTADEKIFKSKFAISYNNFVSNDDIPSNDTISTKTIFSNYFAYDDGSAEAGYGIQEKINCGAALGFEIAMPDTLLGVQIFFNRSEFDVSLRSFDLVVWDKISTLGTGTSEDVVLTKIRNLKPVYTNTINGFTAFKFDQAILVQKYFLVGWEQTQKFVLNIGMDENYSVQNIPAANKNLFTKYDGVWHQAENIGALMIRPMFGKYTNPSISVNEIKNQTSKNEIEIYPNPAKTYFRINTQLKNSFQIYMYDLMGKLVFETEIKTDKDSVNLPSLNSGIYILKLVAEDGSIVNKKIIIE